jgi:Yip1 domain.
MNILQIIFNPVSAFKDIKRENKFPVMALVILILLTTVNLILMVPITSKITAITMSSMPLPESQLDATMAMMHKLRYLFVIGGVFSIAIMLFLYALIFYVITVIAKPAISYMKAFTLIVYGYFAILISEFVNTGIMYFRGLDKITNPFELSFTGLNMFTTIQEAGAVIYTFLCLINPFQIWFIILLSIGIKIFADIKYIKALIICIIFWLTTIIYPIVTMAITESALRNAGIL